jgi:hypothetical protein
MMSDLTPRKGHFSFSPWQRHGKIVPQKARALRGHPNMPGPSERVASSWCAPWRAETLRLALRVGIKGQTIAGPASKEWAAAVGPSTYPWGNYDPPNWDDGNYAAGTESGEDPERKGFDGIYGTALLWHPLMLNARGFFDLGGNAAEWNADLGQNTKAQRVVRGGSWWNQNVG